MIHRQVRGLWLSLDGASQEEQWKINRTIGLMRKIEARNEEALVRTLRVGLLVFCAFAVPILLLDIPVGYKWLALGISAVLGTVIASVTFLACARARLAQDRNDLFAINTFASACPRFRAFLEAYTIMYPEFAADAKKRPSGATIQDAF